ncbi:hypothetical protein LTR84_005064 [Exophiala bonariae]|uniref:Transfer RNA methyltransferase 82 n=1 Tax=Exophiala bonariae TaxID=1690606 RepID=A0AAV9NNP7_9EURO|nr:hypothetical protein LTR84_005064 [Exophiala bonariae]
MASCPFQKLCWVHPVDDQPPFLVTASGPLLISLDSKDGSVLSQWPKQDETTQHKYSQESTENGERSTKRQKLDTDDHVALSRQTSQDSIEIISERKKGERRKPKVETTKQPNFSHLVATSDGTTVVGVMTEDKSINVFQVLSAGELSLQSKRSMPKRMCAIILTPDEKTILVGDKFGDVYSLPLHPAEDWVAQKSEQKEVFIPSATELTVHTKGNLEALRQQREQKIRNPKKEGPDFEHKLLLGHVSLLTDVVIAEIQDGLKRKQFILTSDRDEHIRVSRGVSQAHIIEAYCMGHREFVSCLSIMPWKSEYLVAGSGEPSLKVFDWQNGRLLDEELFHGAVQQDITNALPEADEGRTVDRLAVTGIWPIHYSAAQNSPNTSQPPHILLVALEGLPLLLSYKLDDYGKLLHHQTLTLAGNILDVGIGPALWDIVVSIDTVHRPGSVKTLRPEETPAPELFETFELFSNLDDMNDSTEQLEHYTELRWERSSYAMLLNNAAAAVERIKVSTEPPPQSKGVYGAVGEVLYGLENLRKKSHGEANVDGEEPLEEAIVEAEMGTTPEPIIAEQVHV